MTHLNCDELNRLKIRTPNSHSWPKVQIDKYFIRIYVIIDWGRLHRFRHLTQWYNGINDFFKGGRGKNIR